MIKPTAASPYDVESVTQAEYQLATAHLQLDLKTIDRLLHPDYVVVHPGGQIETKAEVLASYKSGTRHWDRAQVDQLNVYLHENSAIVVGRWQASGQNGGIQFEYVARFLSVWVKEASHWQNIAYQATEIDDLITH